MTLAWAQRHEALLRDCIVSPDIFDHMVERLRDFAVPYQHVLETETSQRNVHLSRLGRLAVLWLRVMLACTPPRCAHSCGLGLTAARQA